MAQILEADKQLWALASDNCRTGLQRTAAGNYPAQDALQEAKSDPLVVALLQPFPVNKSRSTEERETKTQKGSKGKGKRSIESKGSPKGKGKGQKKSSLAPKELIGLHVRTENNDPICFAFNISGCGKAKDGERCSRGFHVCAKCLGSHSKSKCPSA